MYIIIVWVGFMTCVFHMWLVLIALFLILDAPKLTMTPDSDASFDENTDAVLSCSSDAEPAQVTWRSVV